MSGLWTAGSIVADAQKFKADWPWQWYAFIGFVVFVIFMLWTMYDLLKKVHSSEDARTSITTHILADTATMISDGLVIEVRNEGANGRFQAQVEVLESTQAYLPPEERYYDAYWENATEPTVDIMKDHSRRLKLVTFEDSPVNTGWLHVYRMTANGMRYRATDSYPIFAPNGVFVVPEYTLRVTISSKPEPREGPKVITLKVRATMEVQEIVTVRSLNWFERLVLRRASS